MVFGRASRACDADGEEEAEEDLSPPPLDLPPPLSLFLSMSILKEDLEGTSVDEPRLIANLFSGFGGRDSKPLGAVALVLGAAAAVRG